MVISVVMFSMEFRARIARSSVEVESSDSGTARFRYQSSRTRFLVPYFGARFLLPDLGGQWSVELGSSDRALSIEFDSSYLDSQIKLCIVLD